MCVKRHLFNFIPIPNPIPSYILGLSFWLFVFVGIMILGMFAQIQYIRIASMVGFSIGVTLLAIRNGISIFSCTSSAFGVLVLTALYIGFSFMTYVNQQWQEACEMRSDCGPLGLARCLYNTKGDAVIHNSVKLFLQDAGSLTDTLFNGFVFRALLDIVWLYMVFMLLKALQKMSLPERILGVLVVVFIVVRSLVGWLQISNS